MRLDVRRMWIRRTYRGIMSQHPVIHHDTPLSTWDRRIYNFFERVGNFFFTAALNTPPYAGLRAESAHNQQVLRESAEALKAARPEEYAEIERRMRREYLHLDED